MRRWARIALLWAGMPMLYCGNTSFLTYLYAPRRRQSRKGAGNGQQKGENPSEKELMRRMKRTDSVRRQTGELMTGSQWG